MATYIGITDRSQDVLNAHKELTLRDELLLLQRDLGECSTDCAKFELITDSNTPMDMSEDSAFYDMIGGIAFALSAIDSLITKLEENGYSTRECILENISTAISTDDTIFTHNMQAQKQVQQ